MKLQRETKDKIQKMVFAALRTECGPLHWSFADGHMGMHLRVPSPTEYWLDAFRWDQ